MDKNLQNSEKEAVHYISPMEIATLKRSLYVNTYFTTKGNLIGQLGVVNKCPQHAACVNVSSNSFFFSNSSALAFPNGLFHNCTMMAPLQMCLFCRKIIINLLEHLQQLNSIFVNKRSNLRSLQIETDISDWCRQRL